MSRAIAVALLLTVVLAGCGDEPNEPAPATPNEPEQTDDEIPAPQLNFTEPPIVAFSMTLCKQLHGIFSARAADFESALPDGFALSDPDGDGLIDVLVYPTHCEASRVLSVNGTTPDSPYADMMILVAVVPPETDGGVRQDLFALDWILDQDDIGIALESKGMAVTTGTATYSDSAPGSVTQISSWSGNGGGAEYAVETVTSSPASNFGAVSWRIWIGSDGGVVGFINWDQDESRDDGTGAAVFTSNQPGGAPPALPGIAHRIAEFPIIATYWPIDAVDWWTE